nr:hypothetical protein [Tanacetum cinerariifolium]
MNYTHIHVVTIVVEASSLQMFDFIYDASHEGCDEDREIDAKSAVRVIVVDKQSCTLIEMTRNKHLSVSVYAPQSVSSKRMPRSYLMSLITNWNGESLIMGDFNEVRCIEERWGSVFNVHGANAFNSFISNSGLNDIQEVISDFGPTPFRFYHFWLGLPGFDDFVTKSWNSFVLDDSNGMIRFKKVTNVEEGDSYVDFGLQKTTGGVTDDILLSRMEVLKQLHDVQSSNKRDIMQKAKIRWAIEGDENSK